MKQRYLAWLLLIFGMAWCRAGYLEDVFYNIDEAEYAVAGTALNHGWLPGVDLLGCTKPPGIALFFNLFLRIFGHNLSALHVIHVLMMIGMGMLVVELAIALWGKAAAIPSAVLFWMMSNSYEVPSETLALNVESPGMLFVLPALYLAWKKPRVRWALFVTGVTLGIATLFRQSMLLFAIPVAVVVCSEAACRLKRMAYVVGGMLIPWLPVLIVYASAGAIGWAWDSWVRYPLTYSSDGGVAAFFGALNVYGTEFLMQATVSLGMMIGGIVVEWRERTSPRAKFLLWITAASVVAVCTGSRFFPHYWIQLYPIAALLGAGAWLFLMNGSRNLRRILIAAVSIGTVVALLHFPLWRSWDPQSVPRGIGHYALTWDQLEIRIGAFAREHTKPDETVTVWGYCPQIYYYADRLPGTRDYLCHYTTGYSPGTFDPLTERAVRSSGHAHATQMFTDDLEKRKPKYIFDLVQVKDYPFPFFNYSLRDYPEIADYVRGNYLPEGNIGEVMIYRRRMPGDTWRPSEQDVK